MVVAFPGGSGTADMVDVAEAAGTEVWHPLAARWREPPAYVSLGL
jgi:hypothetical protein